MGILETVNEGSTSYLTVDFLDKDGNAAAPSSVSYRVDCLTSGAEIKADTALGASSQVEITLSAADNAIQDQTNERERRLVTVEASFGANDGVKDEYVYMLKNLRKVT